MNGSNGSPPPKNLDADRSKISLARLVYTYPVEFGIPAAG